MTAIVATLLTVLFWPVGLLVAGLFAIFVAARCRHWPRAARVALALLGTCLALASAIVLGDISSGTTTILVQ